MKAWIAREYSQELGLFLHKPKKGVCCWGIDVPMTHITEQDLPDGVNPQWSDDEPIEVELTIKNERRIKMTHTNLKGKERKYTLTDEAHDFIKFKGGSRWLNDTILSIRAYEQNMR